MMPGRMVRFYWRFGGARWKLLPPSCYRRGAIPTRRQLILYQHGVKSENSAIFVTKYGHTQVTHSITLNTVSTIALPSLLMQAVSESKADRPFQDRLTKISAAEFQ